MRIVPFLLLCLFGHFLPAQHCGYCGAALLVVRPHATGDGTVLKDLRITLLDSNNVPMTYGGRPFPPFFRNNDPDAFDALGVNHRPRHGDRLFPIAQDNYVLVIGLGTDLRGCSILVQDERDRRSGTVFVQTIMPIPMGIPYSLCGRYDHEAYHMDANEAPITVIDIPLARR